ncbi:polysaccharide deacetylase family protein [Massilia sp. H-1]|nr:polysaccharide deacetylase family protein [Massilia sp. H-1]
MGRLTEASKYLPPQARIALIKRLEAMVGEHLDHGLMLTPDMVINLDRAGIEIGAHTISHPILTSLDDASSRLEIEGGKRELEAIIGKPVRLFAYPNGKVGKDFDQRHTAMARGLALPPPSPPAAAPSRAAPTCTSCRAAARGTVRRSCSACACCAGSHGTSGPATITSMTTRIPMRPTEPAS